MLSNIEVVVNDQRYIEPLPMSAVYNKEQFITQFVSLHHHSTQPVLVHQLLATQENAGLDHKHPSSYFSHTVAEFWILYDDHHRPIACCGANTAMADSTVGYVGLFEAKNVEAGVAVLNAATAWLRRGRLGQFQPVSQILGPVNLTTWLQYRLRVDDQPEPSMSYEPRHPEFYQEAFRKAGFVKAVDYYTNYFNLDKWIACFREYTHDTPLESTPWALQWWNTLDFAASLTPERHPELTDEDNVAKRIYNLSIKMFHGKDLFDEQVTRKTHRRVVLNDMISRPEVDNASMLDLSSFVVDRKTGRDLGYLACWAEGDTLVLKTVGYLPELHKTKAFAYTVLETSRRARDQWGCTRVACALMNANTSSIAEHMAGPSVRHVYRLYVYRPRTAAPTQSSQHSQPCRALLKQQEIDAMAQAQRQEQQIGPQPTADLDPTLLHQRRMAQHERRMHSRPIARL